MCSTCFPRLSLLTDASLSSTGSSRASSPASSVLSKRYDALPPSRRTSFPSLGGTSVPLVVFAPKRTSEPLGLELVTRCLHPGVRRGANRVLPSSWGTNRPFAHVPIRRRQDCLHQTITVAAAWPLVIEGQRLPRKVFRRSIAWLSDSLSTLRSAGYPRPTQDSLPVAGQALLDGVSTRKIPMKGFRFVIYISFPSLKLTWRKRCYRHQEAHRVTRSGRDPRSSFA